MPPATRTGASEGPLQLRPVTQRILNSPGLISNVTDLLLEIACPQNQRVVFVFPT